MNIRKAEKNDLDCVFYLISELEDSQIDKSNFSKIYINNLFDKNIHYIVAEESGKIVGFISVHIQQLLHHTGSIAEVQELIVTKQSQGSGIGYKLFEEAKKIAIENKCENIEVCCNKTREKSHAFYERLGLKRSHFKFTLTLTEI